jgi:hypothetical protein
MLQRTDVSLRLSTQRIICLFGGMTLLFLATMLSSFAAHDVSMLLQHVEVELKNPLTFAEGVADLYIILQESSYKDDPALENKLISLIKQAQRSPLAHKHHNAPAVAELSQQAVSEYANSRYGLELSVVKPLTHEKSHYTNSTGIIITGAEGADSEPVHKEKTGPIIKKNHDTNSVAPLYTSAPTRRRRTKTPRKKAATSRKKISSASPRTVTKKSSTNVKPSINTKISDSLEKIKPIRKSRPRGKKAETLSSPQSQISQKDSVATTQVKKSRARKKPSA